MRGGPETDSVPSDFFRIFYRGVNRSQPSKPSNSISSKCFRND
jgi:hypothetical protein